MKKQVIAIGLDAADPELLEKWMAQGHLKNLAKLKAQGAYGRLKNMEYYKAETPWTTFLTGCMPDKTGYWGPFTLNEGTYHMEQIEAYDFKEFPPFYALGDEYKVAAFDVPQTTLSDDVNGLQVLAWGAHSPQTPSHSSPEPLFKEIVEKHGNHPALHNDHGDWFDLKYLGRLHEQLKTGISRRITICQDLIQRDEWDLFLTIFGETHSAGHDLWHLSQESHPLNAEKAGDNDPMLDVFESVDYAIGEILKSAPKDAYVMVFAAHGGDDNTSDVPSMALLPEFLYRFSFPDKQMIAPGSINDPVPPPVLNPKRVSWTGEVWQTKFHKNPLNRAIKKQIPTKFYPYLDDVFGRPEDDLYSPDELRSQGEFFFWQPAMWYSSVWTKMKAFAIPSFSEGYVRINLKGREPEGIVEPEDYVAVCDEIIEELHKIINPRTNKPAVKKVVKTRVTGAERDPKLPDADLVVVWEEGPADVVDHQKYGRIGPLPHRRSGSHRGRGFATVMGPNIAPGSTFEESHAVDLAPTILDLMGAPVPEYFDGVSFAPKFEKIESNSDQESSEKPQPYEKTLSNRDSEVSEGSSTENA